MGGAFGTQAFDRQQARHARDECVKKRKISSRGNVMGDLTDDEVEKLLMRLRFHDGKFKRDRDIAKSNAWFRDLPDAQKKYADEMKELVANTSFPRLVETVDSLAGKVNKQGKRQMEQWEEQEQQGEEQEKQGKVLKELAKEQKRQADQRAQDRAENDKKQRQLEEEQERQDKKQRQLEKEQKRLAEEQKRQTNQRAQDRTENAKLRVDDLTKIDKNFHEYSTALECVVDAVTPAPKRQRKAKEPTLEPTAPKKQRKTKEPTAEETAAKAETKKTADDKKAETKKKADERAAAKAAARKKTIDDKKAATLNKKKAKIEEQLAQLTAHAV